MKILIRILFSLIFSIVCFSCKKHDETILEYITFSQTFQDTILVGTWQFIKVDSCQQGVYPNAQVYRKTIPRNNGTITFLKNGSGSLSSSLELYCNYSSFIWQYRTDTLLIKTEAYPYNACINFPSKDSIFLKLESCYPRLGVTFWYEVLTSRIR